MNIKQFNRIKEKAKRTGSSFTDTALKDSQVIAKVSNSVSIGYVQRKAISFNVSQSLVDYDNKSYNLKFNGDRKNIKALIHDLDEDGILMEYPKGFGDSVKDAKIKLELETNLTIGNNLEKAYLSQMIDYCRKNRVNCNEIYHKNKDETITSLILSGDKQDVQKIIDKYKSIFTKIPNGFQHDSIHDVYPREDESKTDFIARFMNETKKEYPNEKQRYAVANSYWEKKGRDSIHDAYIIYSPDRKEAKASVNEGIGLFDRLEGTAKAVFGLKAERVSYDGKYGFGEFKVYGDRAKLERFIDDWFVGKRKPQIHDSMKDTLAKFVTEKGKKMFVKDFASKTDLDNYISEYFDHRVKSTKNGANGEWIVTISDYRTYDSIKDSIQIAHFVSQDGKDMFTKKFSTRAELDRYLDKNFSGRVFDMSGMNDLYMKRNNKLDVGMHWKIVIRDSLHDKVADFLNIKDVRVGKYVINDVSRFQREKGDITETIAVWGVKDNIVDYTIVKETKDQRQTKKSTIDELVKILDKGGYRQINAIFHDRDSVHDEDIDDLTEEEKQAIEDYKQAIAGTKDVRLLELYSHILKEEIEHLQELDEAKGMDSVKSDDMVIFINRVMKNRELIPVMQHYESSNQKVMKYAMQCYNGKYREYRNDPEAFAFQISEDIIAHPEKF